MIKERARSEKMLENNQADLEPALRKSDKKQTLYLTEEQGKLGKRLQMRRRVETS